MGNFFAEFAPKASVPPANGRTITKRGDKTSGLFDDLIPDQGASAPSPSSGLFDDLIPQKPARSSPALEALMALFPDESPASPTMSVSAAPKSDAVKQLEALFPDNPSGGASIRAMTPQEESRGSRSLLDRPMPTAAELVARGGDVRPALGQELAAAGQRADAAIRGIADTTTFGMADRIAAGLAALTGIGGKAGDYSGNLAKEKAVNEMNIGPRVAGQLIGGLLIPGGAAAGGATLGARIGRGALAGAGQGGLYGAGSSEDLTNLPDVAGNAGTGAALGGAIGAGAPIAVSSLGRLANKASSAVMGVANPDRVAAARVASALARDAGKSQSASREARSFDEAAMRTAQDAGQPMIVADMGGEAAKDLARSAANTSPEARAALQSAIDARFESQAPRIAEFVSGLGGGSNATATVEKLQAAAKAANRPAYAKAFAEGANGIWNDQLASLMHAPAVQDAVRGAIKTGANRDVAEGFRPVKAPFGLGPDGTVVPKVNPDGSRAIPSLQFWDGVKRNLDDTIGRLMRSGEKSAAGDAIALRSQLLDALDTASPSYSKARGTAAQFFGAQDAVEAGAKFVSGGRPNAEVARVIAKMSQPEKQLFAHGFASALAGKIEKVPDRRSVLNSIFNSPATRQRVTMALGQDKASKLESYLNVETAMDAVRKAVQGNSTTARQLATLGLAGGLGGAADYLHGGSFTAGAITGIITEHLARHGAIKIDQRIARSVGEMLASSDLAVYKKVLAIAAKGKGESDFIRSITPRAVAAILPAALDELRRKQHAQSGPQTRIGGVP